MASYIWAPDSQHLLFDSDGHLWIYDLVNSTGIEIAYSGEASGDDPKFSPDGKSLSFVRENGLTIVRLKEPGANNVHIGNTVQFIQALIAAGIPYDLQIYPRKTHSIAGPDVRTHLYNRILAQFEQYLKPQPN